MQGRRKKRKNIIWLARGDGYFSCSCWWQGFTGVFTFLLRGGVFCNAQTGNFVFLAIAIGTFQWKQAVLSAAYERLSAGYYGLRNHTKACKADAYHKMGYAFSSHRNDSCNNTGVAARNCAPSDIADNYQFYLRHAV